MENKAFNSSRRFGKWMRKYHLGRSMIEMLGVLAIIGVLSIGGLYAYRQAMERYQISRLEKYVNDIQFSFIENCSGTGEETCAFFNSTDPDYATKNATLFCQTVGICDEAISRQSIRFSFYPKGVWRFYTNRPTAFSYLIFENLSRNMCQALVSANWHNNIHAIAVYKYLEKSPTAVKYGYTNGGVISDEDKELLRQACNTSDKLSINFTFFRL